MEGTGLAGGLALIALRVFRGVPYVVSSGDAVGPYLARLKPLLGPFGHLYERILCRLSAGYIGWSPYLAGRALTFGTPRAMTAANWPADAAQPEGASMRESLGISSSELVFGIIGTLDWNARIGYCYGSELVRAICNIDREDIRVLIVGDGTGRDQLALLAGSELGRRVLLVGRVPRVEVPAYLAAMDVASLPQSVDQLGSFRYTTKLSEYLAAGVPVVTGQIPLAYDLDDGWLWRLRGETPWGREYVDALSNLMATISRDDVAAHKQCLPASLDLFSAERQKRQVTAFICDIATSAQA
jgi:hypothetical protein